jgi:hypothetical protein
MWQSQGKREAAPQLLGEVYGWFTEGLDTADPREAQALLAALAQSGLHNIPATIPQFLPKRLFPLSVLFIVRQNATSRAAE